MLETEVQDMRLDIDEMRIFAGKLDTRTKDLNVMVSRFITYVGADCSFFDITKNRLVELEKEGQVTKQTARMHNESVRTLSKRMDWFDSGDASYVSGVDNRLSSLEAITSGHRARRDATLVGTSIKNGEEG